MSSMKDDQIPAGLERSERWRLTLLPADATVEQAIHSLDESAQQIVLAVAEDDVLIGTVTDGDIRRALLRGLTLDSSIDSIVYRDPLVVPPQIERDLALQLMQSNKVHQLPVVDEQRRVVGLHQMGELMVPQRRSNLMVIMAGGQGRRLRPHTENCPKPLLPVGGKPMLEHCIDQAKLDGFERFVITLHYLGHMIEEYFGDGRDRQISIDYLREEQPLAQLALLHCSIRDRRSHSSCPMAMCLLIFDSVSCWISTAGTVQLQQWRSACTSGNTLSGS